ncbi:MAG: DNA alkylation repair protein [Leptospira sp.]|nr:DNA alkylation repair protein [Leptospira sp.]
MTALKDIYSPKFIGDLANSLKKVYPSLDRDIFVKDIFKKSWIQFELKERMSHISDVMIVHTPISFSKRVIVLKKLINNLRGIGEENFNFPYMFLPEIIQKTGNDNFEESMNAIEFITVFTSAEFVIRHFYLSDFTNTLNQMKVWSKHKDPMVRRLASEGSRPLLPWGIGVPKIKSNPEYHLPILENLWNDRNETVRRSVANHLNDISKINPELSWNFAKDKFGHSNETDKSLRHSLRTLLKRGHTEILNSFDYDTKWKPKIFHLKLEKDKIKMGDKIKFSIRIVNQSNKPVKLRLEYIISFYLANKKYGKKVFQLGEKLLNPKEDFIKLKSHSFAPITTRTYYPGIHHIALVINGNEIVIQSFELKEK